MCKLFKVYTRRDLPQSLPNITFWFSGHVKSPIAPIAKTLGKYWVFLWKLIQKAYFWRLLAPTFAPLYQWRLRGTGLWYVLLLGGICLVNCNKCYFHFLFYTIVRFFHCWWLLVTELCVHGCQPSFFRQGVVAVLITTNLSYQSGVITDFTLKRKHFGKKIFVEIAGTYRPIF